MARNGGQLSAGTIEWGQLSDYIETLTKYSNVPKTSHPIGEETIGKGGRSSGRASNDG